VVLGRWIMRNVESIVLANQLSNQEWSCDANTSASIGLPVMGVGASLSLRHVS